MTMSAIMQEKPKSPSDSPLSKARAVAAALTTAEWEDGIPPDLIISFQLKPLPEITEEIDFVSCPPAPATSADTRTSFCASSCNSALTPSCCRHPLLLLLLVLALTTALPPLAKLAAPRKQQFFPQAVVSTLGFHELPDSFRLAMHCDCCSSTSTPSVAAERHNRRPHEAAEEHSRDFIIGAAAMRSMSSSKQQEEGAAATAGVHAQEINLPELLSPCDNYQEQSSRAAGA